MTVQSNFSIPSLHGPGAVICWICTITSVLVSWACNNKIRFYDTISTDLMAALSLPLIATIQFLHELDKTRDTTWVQSGIREATLTICEIFAWVSPVLILLGVYLSSFRRTIAVGLVGILCTTVHLAAIGKTGTGKSKSDEQRSKAWLIILSFVPFIINLMATLGTLIWRPHPETVSDWKEPRSKTVTKFCRNVFAVAAAVLATGWTGYWCRTFTKEAPPFLPSTPYPITDLDQAVALTAGILTVLLSTTDAFLSRGVSEWEEFEDWRQRSRLFLGEKVIGDEEVALWKMKLDTVDEKVDDLLKGEVRSDLEKLITKHADRIKAEEEAKSSSVGTMYL